VVAVVIIVMKHSARRKARIFITSLITASPCQHTHTPDKAVGWTSVTDVKSTSMKLNVR